LWPIGPSGHHRHEEVRQRRLSSRMQVQFWLLDAHEPASLHALRNHRHDLAHPNTNISP
jgi:hypothetical protein